MTEHEMKEYRQRYYAGMQAMSEEQMKARALAQEDGMRQAAPSGGYAGNQAVNMWPQSLEDEPPKPEPLTRWHRFRQWWNGSFFKDGADGGM